MKAGFFIQYYYSTKEKKNTNKFEVICAKHD